MATTAMAASVMFQVPGGMVKGAAEARRVYKIVQDKMPSCRFTLGWIPFPGAWQIEAMGIDTNGTTKARLKEIVSEA